jgi:hypothetical protein
MMVRAKLLNSPFVILHHTSHFSKDRGDHWDWLIRFPENFLAELGPRMQAKHDEQSLSLLSFASETDPRDWTCATRFWRLAPHRLKYLDYEGEVSGGRGFVKRIATGELQWTFLNDFELRFRLFRLGWLEDSPPRPNSWFAQVPSDASALGPSVGTSIDSSLGQYSLKLDAAVAPDPEPWTSKASDSGPFWRLS